MTTVFYNYTVEHVKKYNFERINNSNMHTNIAGKYAPNIDCSLTFNDSVFG